MDSANWRPIKLEHNNDLYAPDLTDLTKKVDEMSISPQTLPKIDPKTIKKLKRIKKEKIGKYIGTERKAVFELIFNRLPINREKLEEYILGHANSFNFSRDERIEEEFDTVDIMLAYKTFIYRKAGTKRSRKVAYHRKLDEEVKLIDAALCKYQFALVNFRSSDFSPATAALIQTVQMN